MENSERKAIIKKMLEEGRKLPEIQNYLIKEKGDSITYMELRLLLAEMEDVKLPDKASGRFGEEAAAPPASQPKEHAGSQKTDAGKGKTTVTLDSVVRAGAALSGRVEFSSGAKAEWLIDNYGRVGLDPLGGSAKPTPQDIQEFQTELRRLLSETQGRF